MSAPPRQGWVTEGPAYRFVVEGVDLDGRIRAESVVTRPELERESSPVAMLEMAEEWARAKIAQDFATRRRRRLS